MIAEFAEHPAYPISWARADEYCRAMGKRLPTEAEWEKAARGPDERLFPWGNDWNNRMANNSDINIDRDIRSRPVGSFPEGASPYGVLDMAGNVAEWVKDIYEPDAYSRSRLVFRPPWEPAPHVLRGGSFAGNQLTLSAAHRSHGDIDPEAANMGFRCASDR